MIGQPCYFIEEDPIVEYLGNGYQVTFLGHEAHPFFVTTKAFAALITNGHRAQAFEHSTRSQNNVVPITARTHRRGHSPKPA